VRGHLRGHGQAVRNQNVGEPEFSLSPSAPIPPPSVIARSISGFPEEASHFHHRQKSYSAPKKSRRR
jgi:hypothetical protein